jgi:hypothetical protein
MRTAWQPASSERCGAQAGATTSGTRKILERSTPAVAKLSRLNSVGTWRRGKEGRATLGAAPSYASSPLPSPSGTPAPTPASPRSGPFAGPGAHPNLVHGSHVGSQVLWQGRRLKHGACHGVRGLGGLRRYEGRREVRTVKPPANLAGGGLVHAARSPSPRAPPAVTVEPHPVLAQRARAARHV